MKISVVMAYYNRRSQLVNTLRSIQCSRVEKEIIIVDDASSNDQKLHSIPSIFNMPIRIIRIAPQDKKWVNACVPYNIGFKVATGDVVVIQNPECIHCGDILKHIETYIDEKTYFSYPCFSLDQKTTTLVTNMISRNCGHALMNSVQSLIKKIRLPKSVTIEYPLGWYNHVQIRPTGYHFLSAITKNNLTALNGFDERYAHDRSFDDDEFLTRIKRMNLTISIPHQSGGFAAHQFHSRIIPAHRTVLNQDLYHNYTLQETGFYSPHDMFSKSFLESRNVEAQNT